MNVSLAFIRIFFMIISIFFMTTFMLSRPEGLWVTNALIGVLIGVVFGLILVGFDRLFRRFNLRSFNIAILGLFIGYLMGQALVLIFDAIVELGTISQLLSPHVLEIIKIAIFLFGTYLGAIMTLRASDELYISIPFVKFAPTAQKKRDLLIDSSVLADARIIDICSTGIVDHHLVIPRFIIKELYSQTETGDEATKTKARRCLDVIKKLDELTTLGIRFNDTDFPEVKDLTSKFIRLARLIDANILTADITRVQMASIEGVQIINLHSLSNALKPLMETGEMIKIKVQRFGKEPRQGVGYLDDGTMVVINGGGNFIGDVIDAQVLSVKHTSSGRMIFCNALEEGVDVEEQERPEEEGEE
ncbi:MAG: putative PIN and TRAM-domain containing protein YacL [Chlamydiae bacterium]|nr:putative PIN and TRAM-domain containing protein YacL [Chlamydiota bacterium]